MVTLRSFRSGAAMFVLVGFSFSCLYLLLLTLHLRWRSSDLSSLPTPSPYALQLAAYNRLISLPLSSSTDLAYGPLSLPHRRQCHPFLFPRPSSTLFVTAWANHGAGLGHQFGEWLYGASIAFMLNLTYVHTPFMANSARWDGWLGFGTGEETEADVPNLATHAHLIVRTDEAHMAKSNRLTIEDWVREQIAEHNTNLSRTIPATPSTPSSSPSSPSSALVSADPETEVTLLRIYRVHVPWPSRRYSCHPDVNLILRQKYCAARLRQPVLEELYREDREAGRVVVAFHLRCGDSCFSPFRATPLPSVVHTIRLLADTLTGAGMPVPAFHLFSQPPQNDTAEHHFEPVMSSSQLAGIPLTGHWHTHAHTTLHHLVTADILIGAQSSFSWVASLLHHTVAMGPVDTCRWQVAGYERLTGAFDQQSLLKQLNASRPYAPNFASLDDCHALRKWTDGLQPDETGYNEI